MLVSEPVTKLQADAATFVIDMQYRVAVPDIENSEFVAFVELYRHPASLVDTEVTAIQAGWQAQAFSLQGRYVQYDKVSFRLTVIHHGVDLVNLTQVNVNHEPVSTASPVQSICTLAADQAVVTRATVQFICVAAADKLVICCCTCNKVVGIAHGRGTRCLCHGRQNVE